MQTNDLPEFGTPFRGGFFAGVLLLDGAPYTLSVADKALGERGPSILIPGYKSVPGARSYNDGFANTAAMAEAGSKLAQWARRLTIGEFSDWYLPSQDELELVYRNLKPGTGRNSAWMRSGINLSAVTPTRPYLPDAPAQTSAPAFQQGGEQALALELYWSSTQHAEDERYAWCQDFGDGDQGCSTTSTKLRARAVRRSPL